LLLLLFPDRLSATGWKGVALRALLSFDRCEDWMGRFRVRLRLLLGLAAMFSVVGPAFAVQATLVADVHVNSPLPAVNSGAISNLYVGAGYTSLLQFDLGMLPSGTTAAQVSKAVLRVYCNRVDTAGPISVQPVQGRGGSTA
jgi:hypothetical protein